MTRGNSIGTQYATKTIPQTDKDILTSVDISNKDPILSRKPNITPLAPDINLEDIIPTFIIGTKDFERLEVSLDVIEPSVKLAALDTVSRKTEEEVNTIVTPSKRSEMQELLDVVPLPLDDCPHLWMLHPDSPPKCELFPNECATTTTTKFSK